MSKKELHRKQSLCSQTETLVLGDCLIEMQKMGDKSVDLVLTDPPYGLGIDGQKRSISTNPKHNRKKHEFREWDSGIPPKEYFDEIFRISKNQIIWGGELFCSVSFRGAQGMDRVGQRTTRPNDVRRRTGVLVIRQPLENIYL